MISSNITNFLVFNWWDKYHHILLLVVLGTLILLFALTLKKSSYTVQYINYLGFISIIILLILVPINNIATINTLWFTDDYLYLAFYLIGGCFIGVTLINISELTYIKENKDIEFPMLVIMGFISTAIMLGSTNLMAIFIALEGLAFLSYVLVAFERGLKLSALAGIRYLFLGAIPTGIFVLGIVELYSFLGTFNLDAIEKLTRNFIDLEQTHLTTSDLNFLNIIDIITYINNFNENNSNINSIYNTLFTLNNDLLLNQLKNSDIYFSDCRNYESLYSTVLYYNEFFNLPTSNILLESSYFIGDIITSLNSTLDKSFVNYENIGSLWLIENNSVNNNNTLLQADFWLNNYTQNNDYSETLTCYNILLENNLNLNNNIISTYFTTHLSELNSLVSKINEISNFDNSIFLSNNDLKYFATHLLEGIKQIDLPQIPVIVKIAIILVSVNLLFKITAVPFNMWAPRVYEGAPLPAVMFLTIFSKIAVIFFMLRFFLVYFYDFLSTWAPVLLLCGLGSMIAAIIGAISETKIKRFFVFSSMSHVGLMLLAIACANLHGGKAVIIYLIVYTITSLGGWTIIMLLIQKTTKNTIKRVTHITNLKGLAKNNALLSFFLAIIMLSMSGIPPLAGFFAKFEVLYALTETQLFGIAFLALLLSVISFFYYLRIIKVLYFDSIKNYKIQNKNNSEKAFILSIGFLFTIFFIIYMQQPLIYCIHSIFKSFFKEIFIL